LRSKLQVIRDDRNDESKEILFTDSTIHSLLATINSFTVNSYQDTCKRGNNNFEVQRWWILPSAEFKLQWWFRSQQIPSSHAWRSRKQSN
jgi:hypothetical protein